MLHLIFLVTLGMVVMVGISAQSLIPVKPNLLVIVAVYTGQFYLPVTGMALSFVLGLMTDILSGGLLGLNAFSMVLTTYMSYVLSRRIVISGEVSAMIIISSFYLLYGQISYLLLRFFNLHPSVVYGYLPDLLLSALLVALATPPGMRLIRMSEKRLRFVNERDERPGNLTL